jgi:hypothetical protein
MSMTSPVAANGAAAQATDDLLTEALYRELIGLENMSDTLRFELKSGKAPAGDLVSALSDVHQMSRHMDHLMSYLFPEADDN